MALKQKPKQETDGEVVYRRVLPPAAGGKKESRLDPTLLPLVAGFAVLLLLVWILGSLSVRRLEDTSSAVLNDEQTHATKVGLLLKLRVSLTKLDVEARKRMEATARRELAPPFDIRLDTARGEVVNLIAELEHAPLAQLPTLHKFHDDLAAYVETTKDKNRYLEEGFARFRDVDLGLDDLIKDSAIEEIGRASCRERV